MKPLLMGGSPGQASNGVFVISFADHLALKSAAAAVWTVKGVLPNGYYGPDRHVTIAQIEDRIKDGPRFRFDHPRFPGNDYAVCHRGAF
jgi:hypothetical protein